jgi:superfamily II DNA/RNA helicase
LTFHRAWLLSISQSYESAPMTSSFADLGVPADLVAVLARQSIIEPFPIQSATVADTLAGRDVCGKAPTGSGKTLAFGIGAVARLGGGAAQPGRPRVLVLTPTRELCAQVAGELQLLASVRNRKVASFYGGVGYGPQLKALARGVDIAVACPGRLADLIQRKSLRLDRVETVVIDEADRMADMGFLPEVRRILDETPRDRQTVLFSATLDGDIDVLVRNYQRDPVRHEYETPVEDTSGAHHLFWKVASLDRVDVAAQITTHSGPTIVFCRTKFTTDRIARQLGARGIRATAIHGDRSQKQRERALQQFVDGDVEALVATDVAARGIHVDGVTAVVHFDPPADIKDYVHRSGRTARAGATGVVVSLVTPEKASAVKRLQREFGVPTGLRVPQMTELTAVLGPPPERREHRVAASSRPVHPERDRHTGGGRSASGGVVRPGGGVARDRPVGPPRTQGGVRRSSRPGAGGSPLGGRRSQSAQGRRPRRPR